MGLCGAIQNPAFPKQQLVPGTRLVPGTQLVPGTRMPTLDAVLSLASKGTFKFNIETKIFADQPGIIRHQMNSCVWCWLKFASIILNRE